ncbi:hypothetical protein IF1G_09462 [Cordyceps javanica]|uniref:Uncharacterized protein n=1 Tax=Cordyceps javanica TaxID=43265 RepID=A0A545UQY8_9HYPO|nr:hypothetical protein IF1G_09462 [Cordyceps javanica]
MYTEVHTVYLDWQLESPGPMENSNAPYRDATGYVVGGVLLSWAMGGAFSYFLSFSFLLVTVLETWSATTEIGPATLHSGNYKLRLTFVPRFITASIWRRAEQVRLQGLQALLGKNSVGRTGRPSKAGTRKQATELSPHVRHLICFLGGRNHSLRWSSFDDAKTRTDRDGHQDRVRQKQPSSDLYYRKNNARMYFRVIGQSNFEYCTTWFIFEFILGFIDPAVGRPSYAPRPVV